MYLTNCQPVLSKTNICQPTESILRSKLYDDIWTSCKKHINATVGINIRRSTWIKTYSQIQLTAYFYE